MMRAKSKSSIWAWVFALGLLAVIVHQGYLTAVDHQVEAWMETLRSPGLDRVVRPITFFGGTPWIAGLIALMVGWWWMSRQRGTLAIFLGSGLCGLLAELALRLWVGQWRPDSGALPASVDLMMRVELSGFPSGHAFRAAWLYGWWAAALLRQRTRWATVGALACGALILLVGLTRVYLHRHWLTDVVGGWLVAMTVLSVARRRRRLGPVP